jgi:hypothetical protein
MIGAWLVVVFTGSFNTTRFESDPLRSLFVFSAVEAQSLRSGLHIEVPSCLNCV